MLRLSELKKQDIINKVILVRVDLNIPIDDKGNITDTTRLVETLPTINYLIENKGRVVLITHFGRPTCLYDNEGNVINSKSHRNLGSFIYNLGFENIINEYKKYKINIKKINSCIGDDVKEEIDNLSEGNVLLLDNVRYYIGETKNDQEFCKKLANGIDIFIMDAFGTSHRKHASTYGIKEYVPINVMGFLMEKEIKYLNLIMNSEETLTMTAIIGGSKVSSKFKVLSSMIKKCNKIIIGGGMANTFLKATGVDVGKSLIENELIEDVKLLMKEAQDNNVEIILPTDMVIAETFSNDSQYKIINDNEKCDEWMILDIGPKTIDNIKSKLLESEIVIWNGPLGVFEMEAFSNGTREIALFLSELAEKNKTIIAGGGDSIAAINKYELADKYTHISTGGGAMLEYLEGNIKF